MNECNAFIVSDVLGIVCGDVCAMCNVCDVCDDVLCACDDTCVCDVLIML